jgi:hypothetical protein
MRTSKMIRGVGSHQPPKMHKTVYWWLETTDWPHNWWGINCAVTKKWTIRFIMNIWQRWWSAQSLFHIDERKQHTEYVKPLSRPIRPIHTFSTASLQWMSHRCFNTTLKTSQSMECRTQPSLMLGSVTADARIKRKEIIFLINSTCSTKNFLLIEKFWDVSPT